MRALSSTFWFAIGIFKLLKCEMVNLIRCHLAGMSDRQIKHATQCTHDVIACAVTCGMMWHYSHLLADKLGPTIHMHYME